MIAGIGIDVASIGRTRQLIGRFGARFTGRVFTPAERAYCDARPDPAASYAARFAAKEAAMKALGAGWGRVRFNEIEVTAAPGERPTLSLSGAALDLSCELDVNRLHLSLSHEGDLAMAEAVAETAR
jgi:holo-[acyl-carrier protein] synthase